MIRCERATVERAGRVVVEAVSFTVAAGQALAIVGRTGAGKSSLLAAAATALPLHAGEILVDGLSVRREAHGVRRVIGYVPDRLPAWPGVGAGEFLELFAAAAGLRGGAANAAVSKALAMAGLEAAGEARLETLAAGHAKRLLVARALLHDPQVLLLDDPFGGLDPVERREVERLIGDAHLMGRTVLAAIDDANVRPCFTHLAVLREGRLDAAGAAEPAAFGDRSWTAVLVCRGGAERAAAAVGSVVDSARALDADHLEIAFDSRRATLAGAVAAAVAAGIAVERADFEPPWPAQLL